MGICWISFLDFFILKLSQVSEKSDSQPHVTSRSRVCMNESRFLGIPVKNPQDIHWYQNPFERWIPKPIWQHDIQYILTLKNLQKFGRVSFENRPKPLVRKHNSIYKISPILFGISKHSIISKRCQTRHYHET